MSQRSILLVAGAFGFLAVAIGAFGAHAWKDVLMANGRIETFQLAVQYQFYHTMAILAVGILIEKFSGLRTAFLFFTAGIIIFSGSLYILSLSNQTWWGAVTPLGGLALMAGWLSLVYSVVKQNGKKD